MPATVQSLGLDRLPVEEQIALVHELWDYITARGGVPRFSEAYHRELRRRIAEDDADPGSRIPWEVVKREAFGEEPL